MSTNAYWTTKYSRQNRSQTKGGKLNLFAFEKFTNSKGKYYRMVGTNPDYIKMILCAQRAQSIEIHCARQTITVPDAKGPWPCKILTLVTNPSPSRCPTGRQILRYFGNLFEFLFFGRINFFPSFLFFPSYLENKMYRLSYEASSQP
jgi:hypothetical protein